VQGDLQSIVRDVADHISRIVKDVEKIEIVTKYVEIDAAGAADFGTARPAAQTTIKVDGDTELILPMRRTAEGLTLDASLLQVHQSSVMAAIEYRAKILAWVVQALEARL